MGWFVELFGEGFQICLVRVGLKNIAKFQIFFNKFRSFFYRATRIAFRHCSERLLQGQSQNVAVNNTGLELTKAAELHGRAFVADSFYEEVVNGKNRQARSVAFQKVLENLLELHLLNTFFRQLGDNLRVSF